MIDGCVVRFINFVGRNMPFLFMYVKEKRLLFQINEGLY